MKALYYYIPFCAVWVPTSNTFVAVGLAYYNDADEAAIILKLFTTMCFDPKVHYLVKYLKSGLVVLLDSDVLTRDFRNTYTLQPVVKNL
jgi:hypothetical protein